MKSTGAGARGGAGQVHARLLEQAVALGEVAGRARRDDVLPRRVAAARARYHVVERQPATGRAAVHAAPAVPGEEHAPRDATLDGSWHAHVLQEPDHERAYERPLGGAQRLVASAPRPRPCPSTRERALGAPSTRSAARSSRSGRVPGTTRDERTNAEGSGSAGIVDVTASSRFSDRSGGLQRRCLASKSQHGREHAFTVCDSRGGVCTTRCLRTVVRRCRSATHRAVDGELLLR